MTIAEQILRAKSDYDEVFEAGKRSVEATLKFTDVASNSYRTTAPNNVLPFAKVNKIGGMTHKTRNLIPPATRKTYTSNGITYTVNDDGSIVANGTATAESNFEIQLTWSGEKISLVKGKTYTLSAGVSRPSNTTYRLIVQNTGYNQAADIGSSFVANYTDYYAFIRIYSGYVANNLTFYPMLNEGTTALPFEPYFEGLRNAEVTELKSEFGNLFNYDNILDSFKGTGENEGKIVITTRSYSMNIYTGAGGSSARVPREYWNKLMFLTKGTYYAYFDIDFYEDEVVEADRYLNARAVLLNGEDYWCGNGGQKLYSGGTFTMYYDGYCYLRTGINKRCYISNLMITRTPRDTYIPYKYESIPIPEAIKSLDGYGLGVNSEYYNYIDFDRKVFVQNVYRKVFDGTETWIIGTTSKTSTEGKYQIIYTISDTNVGVDLGFTDKSPIVCNSYITGNANDVYYCEKDTCSISSGTSVQFYDEAYNTSDISLWKAHIAERYANGNPLTIVYALVEPIETDISAYLTDEYIEVEGGGTITVVNEYGLDAPTNISYLIDTQGG